jgi:hypothetical protein
LSVRCLTAPDDAGTYKETKTEGSIMTIILTAVAVAIAFGAAVMVVAFAPETAVTDPWDDPNC